MFIVLAVFKSNVYFWGGEPNHYRELWKGTIALEFVLLDF